MLSAPLCREQQAIQQEIADTHPPESRRQIAATAIAVWAAWAELAEKRDLRVLPKRDDVDAIIAAEFAIEDETARARRRTIIDQKL